MPRRGWRQDVRMARLMIGVPDYEAYVAHLRARHPERPVMTHEEFFDERMATRHRSGGGRCC
ncbi:YbdD/YjiX family protein [Myxococcus faecalis]